MFFGCAYRRVRVFFRFVGDSYWSFWCLDPRLGGCFGVWDVLGDLGVVVVDDVGCADVVVYLVGFGCSIDERDIVAHVPGVVCVGRDRLLWLDESDGWGFWHVAGLMLRFDSLFLLSWGKYRCVEDYCLPEVEGCPRLVHERLGYDMPHHRSGAGGLGGVFGVGHVAAIWRRLLVGPNIFCSSLSLGGELGSLGGVRHVDCCFAGSGVGWGFGHRELLFNRLGGDRLSMVVNDCRAGSMVRDDVGWLGDYADLCCASKVVLSPWGWSETSSREFVGNLNGCVVVKPGSRFIEQWFESEHVECRADFSDVVQVVERVVDSYHRDYWEWRASVWRDRLRDRDIEIAVRMSGIFNMVACG